MSSHDAICKDIIEQFKKENPQILRVEWDAKFNDLTIWFKDNPKEPFSISEFIRNTPTWNLMDKLTSDLKAVDE